MKKIMTILAALLLCMMMGMTALAHPIRMADDADLLTTDEELLLEEMFSSLSEELQFDIVVVTAETLDGKSAQAYADDYYDYNGYGMGEDNDGALFLVSLAEREWYISTCGYGIAAISDQDLYYMEEEIVPYLSSGDYALAFERFAECVADCVEEANTTGQTAVVVEEGTSWGAGILLSIPVGFLLAFIPMLSMKKKMKTVVARQEAAEYMDRSSAQITRSHDRFLYHTISRVYTPPQETSTTHTSSSGMSHGGRGGSF
jgi:uncharacterized protein